MTKVKHGPSVHDPGCDSWCRGAEMHMDPNCSVCRERMARWFHRHPDPSGVGGWTEGGAA